MFSAAGGEANLRHDPDDPSRRMIRVILGAAAEYERNMVVLRLRWGRASKAGRAATPTAPSGRLPVGRKALTPLRPEQATVRRIRQLHRDGMSIRKIVELLNIEGIPAKQGGRWHLTTVARVLDRAS